MSTNRFTYDDWVESLGVPFYRGFYVEDLRTLELGYWDKLGCECAFIQLSGQEGISQARVSQIPAAKSLRPSKLAVDELVYILQGRGVTSIGRDESHLTTTFEWQTGSMFFVPRHAVRQYTSMQGGQPSRLLHYNYLPLAMSVIQDPDFFFDNSYITLADDGLFRSEAYARARMEKAMASSTWDAGRPFWSANLFPDLLAWDKFDSNAHGDVNTKSVLILYPESEMSSHMSVFSPRTYKKAHRHGPGRVIVILRGQGYSIMWPEDGEKTIIPWHEASLFVPPNQWFHQHFSIGDIPTRYLAFHPLMQFYGHAEKVEDRAGEIIEFPDEDPWIRKYYAEQLCKRGLTPLMPDPIYHDRAYVWRPTA